MVSSGLTNVVMVPASWVKSPYSTCVGRGRQNKWISTTQSCALAGKKTGTAPASHVNRSDERSNPNETAAGEILPKPQDALKNWRPGRVGSICHKIEL